MLPEAKPARAVKIYISYAYEAAMDERLKKKLILYLNSLSRSGLIDLWDVQQVAAGNSLEEEIVKHLVEANIILCLISPDFIASDRCIEIEMPHILKLREAKEVPIIPIILRYIIELKSMPLYGLQCVPVNYRPVIDWPKPERVLNEIAHQIARLVHELIKKNA